jgi:hypothetical protein
MAERNDPFGLGQAAEALKSMVKGFQIRDPWFAPDPEEDWTNPDYVLGAVLAQIEDLTPQDKCRVLADALTQAIAELR